jgi:hypothetical protein
MMKLFLLATAVLFTVYFAGCGNDNEIITNEQKATFSGQIQNWNLGSNKKMISIATLEDTSYLSLVMDSCTIDSQGKFTINMGTPMDSALKLFTLYDTMCTHHTVINPSNLYYCYIDLAIEDSSYNFLGYLYRSNDSTQNYYSGKIYCDLYYFDNGGSITGTDTCNYSGIIYIQSSSVTQVSGWNSIFRVYDSVSNNFVKLRTTTQPQNVQWYFHSFTDKTEKQGEFYRRDALMKGR